MRIMPDELRSTILVGTKGSEVYEITRASGRMSQLAAGHTQHELWGLAAHPKNPHMFVTAGDDKTVRLWDAQRKKQLALAVRYTPTGLGSARQEVLWYNCVAQLVLMHVN